jgi:hypothetical protein
VKSKTSTSCNLDIGKCTRKHGLIDRLIARQNLLPEPIQIASTGRQYFPVRAAEARITTYRNIGRGAE